MYKSDFIVSERFVELFTSSTFDHAIGHVSWQLEGFEVGTTIDRGRGRRQILTAIVQVALFLRQLVKDGRILAVERCQIDVVGADRRHRQEQDITVDGQRPIDTTVFHLVAFVCQPFHWRQQIIEPDGRDHLLDETESKEICCNQKLI